MMEPSLAFITHSMDSYPSKQPQIDEAQLARRKRRRTTPNELATLEEEFRRCTKPGKVERMAIAKKVGMMEKAVQIWFQNKRQSMRRLREQQQRPFASSPMAMANMARRSQTYSPSFSSVGSSAHGSVAMFRDGHRLTPQATLPAFTLSHGHAGVNAHTATATASTTGGSTATSTPGLNRMGLHTSSLHATLSDYTLSSSQPSRISIFRDATEETDGETSPTPEPYSDSMGSISSSAAPARKEATFADSTSAVAKSKTDTENTHSASGSGVGSKSGSGSSAQPATASKSVRLTMSADGKAQVVVRPQLKEISGNVQAASRVMSLPTPRELDQRETECIKNLLLFKAEGRHT